MDTFYCTLLDENRFKYPLPETIQVAFENAKDEIVKAFLGHRNFDRAMDELSALFDTTMNNLDVHQRAMPGKCIDVQRYEELSAVLDTTTGDDALTNAIRLELLRLNNPYAYNSPQFHVLYRAYEAQLAMFLAKRDT